VDIVAPTFLLHSIPGDRIWYVSIPDSTFRYYLLIPTRDVKTGFFSKTGNRFAGTGFFTGSRKAAKLQLPWYRRSVRKGANLSAEIENSLFSKVT